MPQNHKLQLRAIREKAAIGLRFSSRLSLLFDKRAYEKVRATRGDCADDRIFAGGKAAFSPGRLGRPGNLSRVPAHFFRGRPPALPQRDSFFRCFLMVAFPPRLPMQRGQISSVSL